MSAVKKNDENVVRLRSDDDLNDYSNALAGHGSQDETVLQVDRDDDLASVRGALESVQTPRAVLVIPSNAKTLKEGLDYRALRRLQRDLGLDLILIIGDHGRRGLAIENGFRRVFSSKKAYYRSDNLPADRAEGAPFTDPEEYSPAWNVGVLGILVGLVLAAAVAAAAYLAVPSATVVVYPDTQTLARDVDVLVEMGGPRVDTVAQRLAGRPLQAQVQVQGSIDVNSVPVPEPTPASTPTAGSPAASGPRVSNPPGTGILPGKNITLEVRDALRQQLLQQATAEVGQQLKDQLRSNESLPDANIRVQIVSEQYDHNIGDAASTLSGTMEVTAKGLAFNNDDFNSLVSDLWSHDIPKGYTPPSSPNLTPPAVVSSEDNRVLMRVRASGKVQQQVDAGAVASAVRGRSPADAQKAISELGSFVQPAQIHLWPGWASRAYRVKVEAVMPPGTPSSQQAPANAGP